MQTKLMHTNTLTGNECSHKYVTVYIYCTCTSIKISDGYSEFILQIF